MGTARQPAGGPAPARTASLARLLAEFIGTALLVTAVVGSGIAASHLSPGDVGLQLFENAAATAAALVAIILALGPISGAHLNPAITPIRQDHRGDPPIRDEIERRVIALLDQLVRAGERPFEV